MKPMNPSMMRAPERIWLRYEPQQRIRPATWARWWQTRIAPCSREGIFLYPPTQNLPEGKLRLMLEVNPYALLVDQAGGKALSSHGKSPLTIPPKTVHDRVTFFMGSKENVDLYAGFLSA